MRMEQGNPWNNLSRVWILHGTDFGFKKEMLRTRARLGVLTSSPVKSDMLSDATFMSYVCHSAMLTTVHDRFSIDTCMKIMRQQ